MGKRSVPYSISEGELTMPAFWGAVLGSGGDGDGDGGGDGGRGDGGGGDGGGMG